MIIANNVSKYYDIFPPFYFSFIGPFFALLILAFITYYTLLKKQNVIGNKQNNMSKLGGQEHFISKIMGYISLIIFLLSIILNYNYIMIIRLLIFLLIIFLLFKVYQIWRYKYIKYFSLILLMISIVFFLKHYILNSDNIIILYFMLFIYFLICISISLYIIKNLCYYIGSRILFILLILIYLKTIISISSLLLYGHDFFICDTLAAVTEKVTSCVIIIAVAFYFITKSLIKKNIFSFLISAILSLSITFWYTVIIPYTTEKYLTGVLHRFNDQIIFVWICAFIATVITIVYLFLDESMKKIETISLSLILTWIFLLVLITYSLLLNINSIQV